MDPCKCDKPATDVYATIQRGSGPVRDRALCDAHGKPDKGFNRAPLVGPARESAIAVLEDEATRPARMGEWYISGGPL